MHNDPRAELSITMSSVPSVPDQQASTSGRSQIQSHICAVPHLRSSLSHLALVEPPVAALSGSANLPPSLPLPPMLCRGPAVHHR